MFRFYSKVLFSALLICLLTSPLFSQAISGELKKWHKVTLSFNGPTLSETGSDNPFLNYRLNVTFTNGNKTYVVPGYFAADGNAAESSATSGNVWRVHFRPDEIGTWNYSASFRKGNNVAISSDANAGTAVASINGKSGSFNITPSDKTGRDNRSRGRLQYVGERYLRWAETGDIFIKAGADAPENFLAYEDFDNTPNSGGRRKSWQPHQQDYRAGDPTWKNGKGSEIIGAVNYLASEGLNVFSFLTMNINGDDKNVYPYVNSNNRKQFDCSKLDQWEIVLEHADNNGFYLHFKTQETENEKLLDGGAVGTERKVYYRELIARFGHHLALNWNLGEENNDQTDAQRRQMAQYFADNDPYKNHIVIHTYPGDHEKIYSKLIGSQSVLTGASIQTGWSNVHNAVGTWVSRSGNAGRQWVVANDEQGGANTGVPHDWYSGTPNIHGIRKQTLWGCFMAGGGGVEYYFGYQTEETDLTCQDFRSRDKSWDYCRYALEFLSTKRLDQMTPNDGLASGSNNWCLAKEGSEYIVYLREGGTANLNIRQNGTYKVRWYDPRNGGPLLTGTVTTISGTGNKALGNAPNNTGQDWVVYVKKDDGNEPPVAILDYNITNQVQRTVAFSGTKSYDPDGTISSYSWNFGDGTTATGATATHSYSKDGTYQVSLTVVDNLGDANVAYKSVTVDDGIEDEDICITYGDNWLVFEAEATNSDLGQWKLRTPDYEDYMKGTRALGPHGDDYLEFMGNNQDGGSATSPLEYTFVAPTTGSYRVVARMLQNLNGAAWDKCNDVYIRMDGDYTAGSGLEYSDLNHNQKFYGRGKDNWGSLFMLEVHGKGHKQAIYNLKAGQEYTLTVSGRAQRTCIDYWMIYETSLNISTGSEIDLASENPATYLPNLVDCGDPVETCTEIKAVDFDKWTNISGFTNASTDNQAGKDILQIGARMATAAAQVTYTGANADVYFKINAMQETDGESTYVLKVNGVKIGEGTNDRIYGTGIADYTIQTHAINSTKYALKSGDLIQVEFNNTTNGLVPEGNTTATSRGRWYSIDICTERGTDPIDVTGINPLPSTLDVGTGETATLSTSVIPSNATNKSISWSSSNANIATVNQSGVVTGINIGTATITARTNDGGFTTSSVVTVTKSINLTFYPINDAYLQGTSSFNNADLRVENGRRTTYLMFDLSSVVGKIESAALKLTVGSDAGSGLVQVRLGNGNIWTEQNLTTSNAPTKGAVIGSKDATYSIGSSYTWDLDASAISAGTISLIVEHLSGNDVSFASKENGNSSNSPVLTIQLADDKVPVESVSLSPASREVGIEDCFQFTETVLPEDATDKSVTWSIIGDAGIATVSNTGVVCGYAPGTVQLLVTTNDGGFTAKSTVTVAGRDQDLITSHTLPASISSTGATTFTISYETSTERDIHVDLQNTTTWAGYGNVVKTVNGTGTATFTFTPNPGAPINDTYRWIAYITPKGADWTQTVGESIKQDVVLTGGTSVTGVTVSPTSKTINVGETTTLAETVLPSNATNKSVTWSSSNNAIATVSNGVVTGVAKGNATITVTTVDVGFTASASITVNDITAPHLTIDDAAKYINTDYKVGGAIEVTTTYSAGTGNTVTNQYGGVQVMLREIRPDWSVAKDYVFSDASAVGKESGTSTVVISLNGVPASEDLPEGNFYFLFPRFKASDGSDYVVHGLAPITILPNNDPVPAITIEAESFSATNGTYNDGHVPYGVNRVAGLGINWVNTGDWADYSFDVETDGEYEIVYYISTPTDGAQIQLTIDGTVVSTDNVTNNNHWDNYIPLTASNTANLAAGTHSARVTATGSNAWQWNLDKIVLNRMGAMKEALEGMEAPLTELDAYPNPVGEVLNLRFTNDVNANLYIYNSTGRVVISEQVDGNFYRLPVDNLASGLYIMKVVNGEETIIQRIIKE